MAERIEGLSIGLDLDTLRLDRGLTGLKDRLRTVNAEMRKNMSAFDYGDRSVAKYETRLQGLNKKLEVQKSVTKEAKVEYEKMVTEHGEGSKEAEKAERAYNNQAAALNNLERYVDRTTEELKEMRKEQNIAESTWGKLGKAMDVTGGKLTSLGDKMSGIGKSMSMYVTAPLAGLGGTALKSSIDFESAFAGVRKTVSASETEFSKLEQGIRDMAKELPASASEISGVAESAGQLGIETPNILEFTKTMINLGEATNMTSEEAATSFARFANITEMPQEKFDQLGSVVVSLGNSMATTESEIVDMSMRLAAQGKQVGMTESDIMALSASMSSLGIESEAGGTAMTTVLKKIDAAVGEGGQSLEQFAKTSGVSSKEFKDAWENDPVQALDLFIKGLGKSGEEGKNLTSILKDLGIKGIRESDTILRLAGNSEILSDAVNTAGESWKDNTALSEEAEERYKTLASRLQILKNNFIDVAINIGNLLTPAFETLIDKAQSLINWFSGLSDRAKLVGVFISALAAAIGPTLLAFGTFTSIIGKTLTTLAPFMEKIAKTGGLLGYLKNAFLSLTGPVGITIGIIAALTTGFVIAYKKSETFRNFIQGLGETLKNTFSSMVSFLQPGLDSINNFFTEIKVKFTDFIRNEGESIKQAFINIGTIVGSVLKGIWEIVKWAFEGIKNIISFIMPAVESIIKFAWDNIKNIITGALDIIMGAVKIFTGLFTGDFSKMWEGVKQLFFGAIQAVWGYVNLLFIGRIIKGVTGFAKAFGGSISKLWTLVKEIFSKSIASVWNFVKNGFTGILNTVRTINNTIKTTLSNIWRGIFNSIKNIVTNLWSSVRNIFSKLKNGVVNLTSNARQGIVNQWNKIKSSVSSLASGMWGAVKKTFNNMVTGAKKLPGRIGTGIKNSASKAVSAVKGMGNKMLNALEKPINGMIGGVNWVTDKLGIKKKIGDVALPRFAKGTSKEGHKGGLAIVGEEGRELIELPDGRSFLSPSGDTLLNLPKGTHVVPNKQTEMILKSDLPHFAKGTGLWEGIKNVGSKIKSGVKKAWDTVGDVWDYATNPSKLVNKILEGLGVKGVSGFAKDLGGAAWSFVKKKPLEYIKGLFKKAGGGGKPAFSWPMTSPFGYRIHPITGARKLHGGVDFGAPSGSPVPSTTGGTVSYASGGWNGGFGNLVKVRQGAWEMFYAHLSKILVRAGQSIKKGDILGLIGSTGASTGPHLHYETRKNGKRVNPMSLKGFKTGGIVKSRMMAMLGEDGEEIVIPTARNRRTDAMKLLALAAKKIGADDGSFVRPGSLPNSNNEEKNELLEAVLEQNKYLKAMNETLLKLLDKEMIAKISKNEVGDASDEYQSKQITKLKRGMAT